MDWDRYQSAKIGICMPRQTNISTDPRLLPANKNVAAIELRGKIKARRYVKGDLLQGKEPVSGIFNQPQGSLTCQLLYGNDFRVLETVDGWCFGQVAYDGYVGYILEGNLASSLEATHLVSTLGTGLFQLDDIKSSCLSWLPLGSRLSVDGFDNDFAKISDGYFVPGKHLHKISHYTNDFVSIAEKFLHVPYLWGGNSPLGIDCSGLVSIALNLAGEKCPRDSDQQFAHLGFLLNAGERPERGDLAFWEGHVGIMVDSQNLLHATAFHMLVVVEPLEEVISRIEITETVPYLGLKRLS